MSSANANALASWSAPALWRFVEVGACVPKAPEGWRTPRPGGTVRGAHWLRPAQEQRYLTRRDFLKSTAAAAGAAVIAAEAPASLAAGTGGGDLIDVNVNLGQWPLRRLPFDEPARLVSKLRSHGVIQAWAGSFGGLLHKDLTGVNDRLAEDCRKFGRGLLLPFGSVNPKLPGWEAALRRCAEVHRMPGIRLHPNYHGYRLDDLDFKALVRLAAECSLVVQLALVMEDERMMHPLLRVEPVDTAPLVEVIKETPGLRLVLLNALRTLRGETLRKLVSAGNVSVELSMLEGVGGVGLLLEQVPVDRVLFGSHAPLFYCEAAKLKLDESLLTPSQLRAICQTNAQKLLAA